MTAMWVIEHIDGAGNRHLLQKYEPAFDRFTFTQDENAVIAFSDPADALDAIAALPERHRPMWRVRRKAKRGE